MFLKGHSLVFYVVIAGNSEPILHAKNCTLEIAADILESTTFNSGTAKTYEYARKYGYTLKVDGLSVLADAASFKYFQLACIGGIKLPFIFRDAKDSSIDYTGTVLVPRISLSSEAEALSEFETDFQGDGGLSIVGSVVPPPYVPIVRIIDQFGSLIANVAAPGNYTVSRFTEIWDDLSQPSNNVIVDEI